MPWHHRKVVLVSSDSEADILEKAFPGPPKLLEQSEEEVWYHLNDDDLKNRLTLRCEADENTDRWLEATGFLRFTYFSYTWIKDGESFPIETEDVLWEKEGKTGTIVFTKPHVSHQG